LTGRSSSTSLARPVKAGQSFSATHLVGHFDTIDQMHAVSNRYKGHTALCVDESG
jgi:hypothetical protein